MAWRVLPFDTVNLKLLMIYLSVSFNANPIVARCYALCNPFYEKSVV